MVLNGHAAAMLVRRGLGHVSSTPRGSFSPLPEGEDQLQTWQAVIFVGTCICFYVVYAMTSYTLGNVVSTLVMIEQPTTTVISKRTLKDDDLDAPLDEKSSLLDEEVMVIRQEPITNSIRQTMRHLRSIGGITARFRGFWVSVIYHMLHGLILAVMLALCTAYLQLFAPVASFVCHILATVMLCRLHMIWTHVIISSPNNLAKSKRVLKGCRVFRALVVPSFRLAVGHQLLIILPTVTLLSLGPYPDTVPAIEQEKTTLILRALAVVATAGLVAICIVIPASAHLTRVEASLLPAEIDTIVPFDRTVGGRLTADSLVSVRYFAVMQSFDTAAWKRIIKYYLKTACILGVIIAGGAFAVKNEVKIFGAPQLGNYFAGLRVQLQQAQRL